MQTHEKRRYMDQPSKPDTNQTAPAAASENADCRRRADADRIAALMRQVVWSVPETAEVTNASASTVREAIKRGEIPHVRIGKLIRIPVAAFLQKLADSI